MCSEIVYHPPSRVAGDMADDALLPETLCSLAFLDTSLPGSPPSLLAALPLGT